MNYEDFIYEFIKLLMEWGVWKEPIRIIYGDKVYAPCEEIYYDGEERLVFLEKLRLFEEKKKNSKFRDISNVDISEITHKDKAFEEEWDDNCVMFVEGNTELNQLFDFGVFTTDLKYVPLKKKIEAYNSKKELRDEFEDNYYAEELMKYPEDFEVPAKWEFDSADEYKAFIDEELEIMKKEYIENLSGPVTYDNDLEGEIGVLVIKYGLSYDDGIGGLFIGYDYF